MDSTSVTDVTTDVATASSLTTLLTSDTEEVVTEYEVTSQAPEPTQEQEQTQEKQEKQERQEKADASDDDLPPLVEDTDDDFQWNYLQVETQETYRELHRRMVEELLESVSLTDENKNQEHEEHSENEDIENEDTEDTEDTDADDEESHSEDETSNQESDSDDDLPRIVRRNEGPPTALVFFTLLFVLLHVIQLAFLLQEKRERDAHPCFRVYRP